MKAKVRHYYSLTKPGVLYGNVITAVAGFLLASKGQIDVGLFLATIGGTTLVIASACVVNNYLDQDIDQLMARTKNRAIVSGAIPGRNAVIFGTLLGLIGLVILALYTKPIVVIIGFIGFIDYVVLYGMLSKRLSTHGTLVGSVSGALPIFAGYCAVTGRVDIGAILVFVILFLWQMPEFYSIAIFRQKEYQAAGVPVITVVKGIPHTKVQILLYTIAFVIATLLLTAFGVTGWSYFITMAALGGYWIWLGIKGLRARDDIGWSRQMFRFSLVMVLVFSLMISVDAGLP